MLYVSESHDQNGRPLQNGIHNTSPLSSTLSLASQHRSGASHASTMSLAITYDHLKTLASQVVAVHVCQADNNISCMVPEFVHSIAAYMSQAPQLTAYRDLLLHEPHLQNMLGIRNCIQDPSKTFIKAVLEPLIELKRLRKITADMCVILIDSLNEAEFHKPDYGDTIASFLTKHIMKFPSWLKLVVTVRTVLQDLTKFLPFHRIHIDKMSSNEYVQRDILEYINYRVNDTADIRNNMSMNGRLEPTNQYKFCSHVQSLSRGCMLYCKLLLDLIERGHLVLKSSNYKILPVNLSEVFLLMLNLKFPTIRSFEKVSPVMNICLASLYPLTEMEIFETLNAGYLHRYVEWEDFLQRMDVVSMFLLPRKDAAFMYFHPSFREWLIRREESDSAKFLCDLRFVVKLTSQSWFSNFAPKLQLIIMV